MILLNPGPTNTRFTTKIHQWLGTDKCHREDEFKEILRKLQNKLLSKVSLKDSNKVAIMAGSGTTAMEAMIASTIEDGIIVINAGKYGQRAIEMMKTFKIDFHEIKSRTIEDLTYSESYKKVYFVENETSTGERYSIGKMSKIFPNAKFFIDSTAAFGASNYLPHSDKISALSFCSNKCLQSTPGLGVVIWNGDLTLHKRSYFGYLGHYGYDKIPFTLPTQSIYALNEAIDHSLENKTIFNKRREKLIKEFDKIGITCLNKNPCNSIIAFEHPTRDYDNLKEFLYKRGIVIYSGIEGVKNSFRVSTMSCLFDQKFKKIRKVFYDSCLC